MKLKREDRDLYDQIYTRFHSNIDETDFSKKIVFDLYTIVIDMIETVALLYNEERKKPWLTNLEKMLDRISKILQEETILLRKETI
jgi:hypothetical protein